MKTLLAVLIAAAGLNAASAELLRVKLPAPVLVNGVQLPSGDCTVQELSNGGDNIVLLVRSSAGMQVNVLVDRITATNDGKSGVVLSRRDEQYKLDEVWLNPLEGFRVLRNLGQ